MDYANVLQYIREGTGPNGWLVVEATRPPTEQEKTALSMRLNPELVEEIRGNIVKAVEVYFGRKEQDYTIGLPVQNLQNIYEELYGCSVRFEILGFESLASFCLAIDGDGFRVCKIGTNYVLLPPLKPWHWPEPELEGPIVLEPEVDINAFPKDVVGPNATLQELNYKLYIKPGETMKITLTSYENPLNFHFILYPFHSIYQEFTKGLSQFYTSNNTYDMPEELVRPGQFCVVHYWSTEQSTLSFARARVLQFTDVGDANVILIDNGKKLTVSKSRLKFLHKQFGSFPVHSLPASLAGLVPKSTVLDQVTMTKINFYLKEPFLEAELYSPDFNRPMFPLILYSRFSKISLNRVLIDSGKFGLKPSVSYSILTRKLGEIHDKSGGNSVEQECRQSQKMKAGWMTESEPLLSDFSDSDDEKFQSGFENKLPSLPQTENNPRPAASRPQPVATQSRPQPVATQSRPQPVATQSRPQPAATQSRPQPVATQSRPQPAATQSRPQPVATQSRPPPVDSRPTTPEASGSGRPPADDRPDNAPLNMDLLNLILSARPPKSLCIPQPENPSQEEEEEDDSDDSMTDEPLINVFKLPMTKMIEKILKRAQKTPILVEVKEEERPKLLQRKKSDVKAKSSSDPNKKSGHKPKKTSSLSSPSTSKEGTNADESDSSESTSDFDDYYHKNVDVDEIWEEIEMYMLTIKIVNLNSIIREITKEDETKVFGIAMSWAKYILEVNDESLFDPEGFNPYALYGNTPIDQIPHELRSLTEGIPQHLNKKLWTFSKSTMSSGPSSSRNSANPNRLLKSEHNIPLEGAHGSEDDTSEELLSTIPVWELNRVKNMYCGIISIKKIKGKNQTDFEVFFNETSFTCNTDEVRMLSKIQNTDIVEKLSKNKRVVIKWSLNDTLMKIKMDRFQRFFSAFVSMRLKIDGFERDVDSSWKWRKFSLNKLFFKGKT